MIWKVGAGVKAASRSQSGPTSPEISALAAAAASSVRGWRTVLRVGRLKRALLLSS